ncbi:MAG: translation initiation factor [Bacteroidales bacterium]
MTKKHKGRSGVVYSTDPGYEYEYEKDKREDTPEPGEQDLRVSIDRKGRKGKTVTLVSGFKGNEDDLSDLARMLKSACGTGGSAKDMQVIIQGDFCDKVIDILKRKGYKVKKSGG